MALVTLSQAFAQLERDGGGALAGVVVLGWEDAKAYVQAAEIVGCPIILQAGPGCRRHTPLSVLAEMFRVLASEASIPVVSHLDHGQSPEECFAGIEAGFSSVMYDGSGLPLSANIANTCRVLEKARAAGVSVEAELGVVGYVGAKPSVGTDPEEARSFLDAAPVDALAISVGNTHLSKSDSVPVDESVIASVQRVASVPLVLHGGSGIPAKQRRRIALGTSVAKFNIGTELRQAFGRSLRDALRHSPDAFDRNEILGSVIPPVAAVTQRILSNLVAHKLVEGK